MAHRVQDLIILGLLKEKPKHGYELKNVVDERLRYLAEITSGTVYYTLKKLEKQGFVERSHEREGDRPERNVFSITEAGEAEFLKLLEASFFDEEKQYSPFTIGLYFVKYLPFEKVIKAIDQRQKELEIFRSVAVSLEKSYPMRWPFNLEAIKQRILGEIDTTFSWYGQVRQELLRRLGRQVELSNDEVAIER